MPLFDATSSAAIPKLSQFHGQNLSNTAWAWATRRVIDMPLLEAISAAASPIITEFDIQGLANTLWSFASLLISHFPVVSHIRRVVVPVVSAEMPIFRPGRRVGEVFHEVARYQNHLCQLVWSFSFADRLDESLAHDFRKLMLEMGRNSDFAFPGLAERQALKMPQAGDVDSAKEPELQLKLRGICVVLKPPNWEVDAKGQQSSSLLYLSQFMRRAYAPDPSPVLLHADFEYGFVHRLDVPSSGLVLTGTHFEGYALLQYEMHTYAIHREYSVLLSTLVPSDLRDINVPINDFLLGHSFVDDMGGRPAETHVKTVFHIVMSRRWSIESFGLVTIAIHTGRRHQIRVHTQWEGFPTVTDEKYSHLKVRATSLGLERELDSMRRGLLGLQAGLA